MTSPAMNLIALAGLAFGFVGTLMVAFSFGSNLGGGYQTDSKGRKVYLASFLHPRLFQVGLVLIALGFAAQAIPLLCTK